ncbi:helix-turn-helix domain-containing protein, partial [Exiguobacterium sp. TNDT2]|uniref:helix-turn-helix domain-containing protein n=1 Tax=Exiguobacterium sp. TNDT2 TaxID=2233531 RepID=UPI001E5A2AA6
MTERRTKVRDFVRFPCPLRGYRNGTSIILTLGKGGTDMLKAYKYRLHPTLAQAEFLIRTIGCARFIYNKLLEDRITIHEEAKAKLHLDTAFAKFFAGTAGFPVFKSRRKSRASYT